MSPQEKGQSFSPEVRGDRCSDSTFAIQLLPRQESPRPRAGYLLFALLGASGRKSFDVQVQKHLPRGLASAGLWCHRLDADPQAVELRGAQPKPEGAPLSRESRWGWGSAVRRSGRRREGVGDWGAVNGGGGGAFRSSPSHSRRPPLPAAEAIPGSESHSVALIRMMFWHVGPQAGEGPTSPTITRLFLSFGFCLSRAAICIPGSSSASFIPQMRPSTGSRQPRGPRHVI